jgi:hypothetical protein
LEGWFSRSTICPVAGIVIEPGGVAVTGAGAGAGELAGAVTCGLDGGTLDGTLDGAAGGCT